MPRTRPSLRTFALAAGTLLLCAPDTVRAQPSGGGRDELPAGHPPVGTASPPTQGESEGSMGGVFRAPEDVEEEDKARPGGTISVELRDADDRPVPGEIVTLGILISSIAKGDTRKHVQLTTDEGGRASFSDLETASNIAYRVSCGYQGGAFAAAPFQLPQGKAMHVVLHVYPVTRDIDAALVVGEAAIAAELKDDRIQIDEMFTLYNLGRIAWQPDDVRMTLPTGATAFTAQESMSDQGVDEIDGAAKLRGTFGPGQHSLAFRWQLPWSGDKDVDFDVGLPPHVAIARVLMPASSTIKLTAADFPVAEIRHNNRGQSFLVTERRISPESRRLSSIAMGLHDLPSPGPGRLVASLLATIGIGFGLWQSLRRTISHRRGGGTIGHRRDGEGAQEHAPAENTVDAGAMRQSVLEELALLEKAHTSGDVGPKTYERVRRELIDALALTLSLGRRKGVPASAQAVLP
jgi:hypothetical protein